MERMDGSSPCVGNDEYNSQNGKAYGWTAVEFFVVDVSLIRMALLCIGSSLYIYIYDPCLIIIRALSLIVPPAVYLRGKF